MHTHRRTSISILITAYLCLSLGSSCAGSIQSRGIGPTLAYTPVPQLVTETSSLPLIPTTPIPSVAPSPQVVKQPLIEPSLSEPICQDDWCVYSGHFYFQRPVSGLVREGIDPSYRYATTQNGLRDPHSGVEFPAKSGEPVYAAASGQVALAGNDLHTRYSRWLNFYGNLVILKHEFPDLEEPVYTIYAHLSQVKVRTNQNIEAGQELGNVGATGSATGPHLHFEVRLGDFLPESTRNPELWLLPPQNEEGSSLGVVAGRIQTKDGQIRYPETINLVHIGLDGLPQKTYYLETYIEKFSNGDDLWEETFAQGDLPMGDYLVQFVDLGKMHETRITIFPGKLTFLNLEIDRL